MFILAGGLDRLSLQYTSEMWHTLPLILVFNSWSDNENEFPCFFSTEMISLP